MQDQMLVWLIYLLKHKASFQKQKLFVLLGFYPLFSDPSAQNARLRPKRPKVPTPARSQKHLKIRYVKTPYELKNLFFEEV